MYKMRSEAQRPVIILGGGIRSGNSIEQAKYFVKKLGFPVLPTWGAMDYIPYSDSQIVGSFGVSSERAGNFAVQNSDLVIAIGTRLDTHEIGPKASTFARGAKKVVVDLDESEIDKYAKLGMNVDLSINSDVRDFFQYAKSGESNLSLRDIGEWKNKIREWKQKYPICLPEYRETKGFVNPYVFMDQLSKKSSDNEIVITDAGGNLTWTMQGFRVKGNQRLISAFNHSPMGYSLPASIGAAFASDRPISCIIGDGGLQINPQELATISYYGLPIKIFLINNQGHGIIKQTLDTWLESRYVCVDNKTGLPGPDLSAVANAYGIPSRKIRFNSELGKLEDIFREEGPLLVDVSLHPNQKIVPKLTFGRPIEDSEPLLSREEFKNNMIVPPIN
jgi:acetolactate synthase-1/2/3 large subunit